MLDLPLAYVSKLAELLRKLHLCQFIRPGGLKQTLTSIQGISDAV